VAPDKHCSVFGAPLTGGSDSACTVLHCSSDHCAFAVDRSAGLSLLRWCTRQSGGTPDSPVNYSGERLKKPESGQFSLVQSWCTEHCPVAHRTVSDAPDQGTLGSFAPLYLNPIFNLLLVCVEPLCTCRSYTLEQTS
jgi:hypothetical protein